MNGLGYIKCHCLTCNGKIEFPIHGVDESIPCPHCGWQTKLYDPLEFPLFEGIADQRIKVKSKDKLTTYIVNLWTYSCTCQDFQELRCKIPRRGLLRACRHICCALANKQRRKLLSEFQNGLISNCVSAGIGVHQGTIREDERGDLIFVSDQTESGWIDVVAPVWKNQYSKVYEHFGYSVFERRWSYDRKPRTIQNPDGFLIIGKCSDRRLSYDSSDSKINS